MLAIVSAVAIQIVLSTDIPRKIVIAQVQRILGLRMSAASIDTGWLGNTTLNDVTFSLPLDDHALVETPRVTVSHTSLIPILLGSFDLDSLDIEKPVLHVRQDPAGQWNLVQLIGIVSRSTQSTDSDKPKSSRAVRLPAITIRGGRAVVTDNQNRTTSIDPVTFNSKHAGPLVYEYDGSLASNLQISGKLNPASGWAHEANITATQIDELVRPLLAEIPRKINAKATWAGRVSTDAGVSGQLRLASLSVDQLAASGSAKVRVSDAGVQIEPDALLLQRLNEGFPDIRIISGIIRADQNAVAAESLQLSAYDGLAMVGGKWNRTDNSVELRAAWKDAAFSKQLSSTGSIVASMQTPWPGKPQISASLNAAAQTEAGSVETSLKINGQGESFSSIDWNATIDRLNVTGRRSFELRQVAARLRTRGQKIHLDELQFSDRPQLQGRGEFDLSNRAWWAWAQGSGLPLLTEDNEQLVFAFNIDTWGIESFINLKNLFLRSGDLQIAGDGFYDSQLPKPVNLKLMAEHLPFSENPKLSQLLKGQLNGQLQITGTVNPPDLAMNGELYGRDLVLRRRTIGNLRVELSGELNAEGAQLRTTELDLLGGKWSLIGALPANRKQPAKLQVDVRSLPLKEVADLTDLKDLSGTADASVRFELPSLRITAHGTFAARDVKFQDIQLDRAAGQVDLRNNQFRAAPMELAYRDGKGSAELELPIDRPTQMNLQLSLDRWPVTRANASAEISGQTKLALDLSTLSASGPLTLHATLTEQKRPVGTFHLAGEIERQTLTAKQINADLLGGTLAGTASVNWKNLLLTHAELNWTGIDASAFAAWIPRLDGLSGTLSGAAQLRPVSHREALGPLQLDVTQVAENAAYNGMQLSGAKITAYLDLDRIVTENAQLDFAGGVAKVFARASKRPGEAVATLLTVDFDGLDLNQLVHAADPKNPDSMPGRAAGSATIAGNPKQLRDMFGDGEVRLTQSDLIKFDPLEKLYALLGRSGAATPTGNATIRGRIEGQNLSITSARVFERGLEVRAIAQISDIWNIPDSALSGTAVGTARPFKEIKLPFLADVDQTLAALQSNASTVRISGTVRTPKTESGVFADIGEGLRTMLVGDAKSEAKNTAEK